MTAVQGSVSTFVSVKQLDLINETSGHSPAVFVSYKTNKPSVVSIYKYQLYLKKRKMKECKVSGGLN